MKPTPAVRAGLTVCAALLVVIPISTARDIERPVERTFKVAAGSLVTVGISGGSIAVDEGGAGTVKVVITQRVRGVSTESEADELLGNYDVEIAQAGDRVSAAVKRRGSTGSQWRRGVSFSATLTVPRDVRLDLNTSGGSINVRGTRDAALDANTSGGSIRVDGGRGPMTLDTSGGGITVGEALGIVDASTSGGSITVAHVGPEATDISLNTSGGSIHVGVNERAKLTLRADTSGGRVSVSDLPFVSTRTSTRTRSNEARGTINGGGGYLDAHTSGGSIDIRSSR